MDLVTHVYQSIPSGLIYLLVAVLLLMESSGIPVINTTALLFTGAMAAQGRLHLGLLMLTAVVGSTLGACLAYSLGKRYGEKLLLRLARLLRIKEQKMLLVARLFQKAGGRMVFFSRIFPYVRPFTCFPAGIYAMPFPRFLLVALSGSIIWCVTFLIVGWELGPRWELAMHLVRFYTLPTLGTLLVLLIIYFFVKRALTRYIQKRLQVESEKLERERDLLEV